MTSDDARVEVTEPEEAPSPRPGFVRRHKVLLIIFTLVIVLAVGLGSWLIHLNRELGHVKSFNLAESVPPAERPERAPLKSTNVLLVGVDDPVGRGDLFQILSADEWEPGAFRSDTIMVLHIEANREYAQLVSIPRDSYVEVPGLGRTKINAAFSEGGPAALVKTVEKLTDIYLDHVVVVDFANFAEMMRVIEGVPVQIAGDDEAGPVNIEGEEALRYVRERYSLPRGDFDRIQRQQNVLRAMLTKFRETAVLANPLRLTRLISDLSKLVIVDDALTPERMRKLIMQSRSIGPKAITFVTVPFTGTPTIDGASVVTLDLRLTRQMFDAIEDDRFERWYETGRFRIDSLPPPDQVD